MNGIAAGWPASPSVAVPNDRHRDIRETGKAQRVGGGRSEVDDTTANKRTAIIDAYYYRTTIPPIGDPDHRAERQRTVCGSKTPRTSVRAACSQSSGIDRGYSGLC